MRKLTKEKHGTANLIWTFSIRAGVVYNNGKYFVGTPLLGKTIITTGIISL